MRALVIGAGIGGLAAALALRQAGVEVRVMEREPELREVGAGISLSPNAVRALRHLGLAEQVIAAGACPTVRAVYQSDGRQLGRWRLDSRAAFGEPLVGIHRADLQRVLLESAGPVELGRSCSGYEITALGVTARFGEDRAAECDLLIGADGLRSALRAQLLGPEPPVYSGWTAWRGIAPIERGEGAIVLGIGAHGGWLPVGGGRTYWFACCDAGEADANVSLAPFLTWRGPLAELITATPPPAVLRNDIYDRPPAARWGEGPVSLLGDAAHPMTPGLGQGGGMALEDAVVLGRELRRARAGPAGLRAYESRRQARTTWVVRNSRRALAATQWKQPLARALRAAVFRLPPSAFSRQEARLSAYDAGLN